MFKRTTHWLLNAVTVVCAICLALQFLHRSQASGPTTQSTVKVGSRLNLPGVSQGRVSKTVILAVSAYSQYCRMSAPFYRALTEAAKAGSFRVVVAVREPPEVYKPLLPSLGIADAVQLEHGVFQSVGISATPTLVILDGSAVKASWAGKLSAEQENEVFHALGLPDPRPLPSPAEASLDDGLPTISARDLQRKLTTSSPVVIDIRERPDYQKAHISGALNIPYDEVVARAPHELPRSEPILVYCGSVSACDATARSESALSFCNFGRIIMGWAGVDNALYISSDLDELRTKGVSVKGTTCKQ